ncbi:DUF4142 domain-containing protein [Burkholderia sp. TSV86]|uniref:DUF4142 domain-containing protein n=1 Tax=Burkholderia sp. TSV86 TaxID=1385594 RepID=UPI00075587B2|nr:DUF4142 domain-containing protein [Burkholderia sp. TSV86]KVE36388.1 DUF305 domain-containing protein [Burkholderia sp. TSV86]
MKQRHRTFAALAATVLAVAGAARAQMPSEPPASNSQVPGGLGKSSPGAAAGDSDASKAAPGDDAQFVNQAAIAGKAEVQASQLALKQARSADVRAFAKRMLADHGKANATLNEIAARQHMKPQVEQISDPDVDALRGKAGHDVDVAYLAAAGPGAHRKAIALFEDEARNGRHAPLRAFAKSMLPTLEHHLSMAQTLQRKVGAQ